MTENKQKNILVTGCAGGMGNAVCRLFSSNGYRVFGLDRKEPDERLCEFIQCDLTDGNSVDEAFTRVSGEVESLYAIIHLAGKYDLNSLIEMPEEEFTGIFNINVFSMYRVNKAFISLLGTGSRIIMISSELAPLDPLPFTGIYAITKTTISKYAYSLRMELQLKGIDVIEVRPGAVDTGFLGVSVDCINDFTEKTGTYKYSAENFRKITNSVESRCISPDKLAEKLLKIAAARRPRFVYNINRNPLLIILNLLPDRFQTWVIKEIIK